MKSKPHDCLINAPAPTQTVAAYMRTPEAAAYLGVCPKTVATLVKRRILPAIHLSKRLVLFRRTDLDEALSLYRLNALNEPRGMRSNARTLMR